MKTKNKFKLTTPVLFLVFSRIETTKRVFKEIRKAKPTKLYIAADGPRTKYEKNKTDSVRKYILDNIDWDCKVKTLFRKKNLGVDKSGIGALNWFFENEEKVIYLEDDCLPSQSFFRFSQEMLYKYENDEEVKCVCGANFLRDYNIKNSYTFSKTFFSLWGFSTWRRAWNLDYDKIRKNYKKNLRKAFPHFFQRMSILKKINYVLDGKMQGWDYMFATQKAMDGGLSIVPRVNLVENIGFDFESTHRFNKADKKYLKLKRRDLKFPLKHPEKVRNDEGYDKKLNYFSKMKFIERNLRKIIK